METTRNQLEKYIGYCLDDTGDIRELKDKPANARLVVYPCGFEPMVVAVWSYLPNIKVDDDEAIELADDFLKEIGWLSEPDKTAEYVV